MKVEEQETMWKGRGGWIANRSGVVPMGVWEGGVRGGGGCSVYPT